MGKKLECLLSLSTLFSLLKIFPVRGLPFYVLHSGKPCPFLQKLKSPTINKHSSLVESISDEKNKFEQCSIVEECLEA
jgi:hypothetical protein